jgi:hypothetical protein
MAFVKDPQVPIKDLKRVEGVRDLSPSQKIFDKQGHEAVENSKQFPDIAPLLSSVDFGTVVRGGQ